MKRLKYVFQILKRISGELGHSVLSITQKGIKVKDTESGTGQLSMDYSKYQFFGGNNQPWYNDRKSIKTVNFFLSGISSCCSSESNVNRR